MAISSYLSEHSQYLLIEVQDDFRWHHLQEFLRYIIAIPRAAQLLCCCGRVVTYTVSVRCHLSRHSHGRPPPVYQSRDNGKPMEPCLARDGWETADGTVVPPASQSVKKIMATKMYVGRETCIERIYILEPMRMATFASRGFCLFGAFLIQHFLSQHCLVISIIPQLF